MKVAVREYLDARGESPLAHWFAGLEALAAAKVATALYRLEQGNFSRVEGVGGGVCGCKINFGPGYRVHFGKDGEALIILLGGGSKKKAAGRHWGGFVLLAGVYSNCQKFFPLSKAL